jgi:hypothetical protein
MVDPVIRIDPGDADAEIAHVCEVRPGSPSDGCHRERHITCRIIQDVGRDWRSEVLNPIVPWSKEADPEVVGE